MTKVAENSNKRSPADKAAQRAENAGEHFKKHGTAKSRLRARNRKRAAIKNQKTEE
jgi:hypothetical protein